MLARFSERNYALFDPIFRSARVAIMPFIWREVALSRNLTAAQRAILSDAASFGIVDGVTIPIQHPGALPASCSLVPGPDGVDPLNMPGVFMLAHSAHEVAYWKALERPTTRAYPGLKDSSCAAGAVHTGGSV